MAQKKTIATGIAAAAIVTTSLAAPGIAQAQSLVVQAQPGAISYGAVANPLGAWGSWQPFDNNELFDEYVHRLFYGDPGIQLFGTSGRDHLDKATLGVYDEMLGIVEKIASGERSSTNDIYLTEKTLTYYDLGMSGPDEFKELYESDPSGFNALIYSAYGDISTALSALLDDRPFDFYWYDKANSVGAGAFSFSFGISYDQENVTLTPKISFTVASEYRANNDPNVVDDSQVKRAQAAAGEARAIVEKNKDLGDFDKLTAYKDAICELVDYNHDAADSPDTPYGDPWQLVYVFDNDPDSKVVCEGYAKAFQYLCDLSEFDSDIRCTTVTGDMVGATGAGGHMWNVVRMGDGRNYLVDVTNSDDGSVGENGGLFVSNYTGLSEGYRGTYTFLVGFNSVAYSYDSETLELYSEGYLALSKEPYDDNAVVLGVDLAQATVSVTGSYTYDGQPQIPAANDVNVAIGGETVPSDAYVISASNNTNAGTADVTVTAKEDSGYRGFATGTFTIRKATPTVEVAYDGDKIYPTTTLADIEKNLKVKASTEGELSLADAELNIGRNSLAWTFTPADTANYVNATGTVDVNVFEDALADIDVTTPPNKMSYAYGESFNPEGMVVTAAYESGRTEVVEDYEIAPSGGLTHVGKNTITITYEGKSVTIDVTVAPQTVTPVVSLTGAENLVYDGSAQQPGVTVTVDGEALAATEYKVSYENNVNAGTATVIVTDAEGGQYQFQDLEKTFQIAQRELVPSIAGTTAKIYDGDKSVDCGLSISLDGVMAGDEVSASAQFSYDDPNAGTKKSVTASEIKLSGADSGNYRLATTTLTSAVGTIEKATPSGTVSYEGSQIWEGSDLSDVEDGLTWNGLPSAGTVTLAEDTVLNVGTHVYTWTFSPEDSTNYTTVTGTVELTISADGVVSIAVSVQPTKTAYTYGETFDPSGMVVTATYASGATADIPLVDLTFEPEALTTDTTQVVVEYAGASTTIGVAVSPKEVAPALTLTGAENLVYDGVPHEPGVVARDGETVIPVDEYVVTYESNVDAGTASVRVSDAPGGNYQVAEKTATFQIAQAEPTLSVSVNSVDYEFGDDVTFKITLRGVNGEGINETVSLTVDGETYDVPMTNGVSTLVVSGFDASKDYEAHAFFAGSRNYESVSAYTSFSLDKATPVVTVSYSGGVLYPSTPIADVLEDLEVSASVAGSLSINAGALQEGTRDYAWTFTPYDQYNYNVVTGTLSLTVSHDRLVGIAVTAPAKTAYAYGEVFDPAGMVVTATYASGRTVDVTDLVSFDRNLTVGQTSIRVLFADGTESAEATVAVTVSPRAITPDVELSDAKIVYDGAAQEPVVTLYDGDVPISASEYVVTYENNVNAGTATMRVDDAPGGNYEISSLTLTFEIARATYGIEVPELDKVYDGAPVDFDASDITVVGSGEDILVSYDWYQLAGDEWVRISETPSGAGDYRLVVSVESDDPNYEAKTERAFEFNIEEEPAAEPEPEPDLDQEPEQSLGQSGLGGEKPGQGGQVSGDSFSTPSLTSGSQYGKDVESGLAKTGDSGASVGSLLAFVTCGLTSLAAAFRVGHRRQ